MKKVFVIIIILFGFNSISGQTVTRDLDNFSSLSISNALEVRLVQGDKNEAVISVPDASLEVLESIKTEIIDDELSIYRKGKVKSKKHSLIILTFKRINKITQSGASKISTLNVLKSDYVQIKGSGAIEADLNIEATDLTIDLSGASDIELKGFANNFTVNSSGASDLKASSFVVNNVIVDVSGASDIRVRAVESISGEAKGASSVSVLGSPKVRTINSGGASSIQLGKQHLKVSDNDDLDLKLGNKRVVVTDYGDTTKLKWGGKEFSLIDDSLHISNKKKKRRNHWSGLDLAMNGFINSKNSLDLSNDLNANPEDVTQFMSLKYTKSWSFAINFAELYVPIKKHRFGIVTGLGTEWNNYELKYNVKLNSEGGSFVHPVVNEYNEDYTWGEIDTVLDYSKNRFKTWFINVPLLLELNTGDNKNKSFHISAGAIVGFNLQTKIKYQYRLDGEDKKEKDKQEFNTNPFRVITTVRIGVGRFNMFATYSITPLFEDGRGPELYPFTVGVTLLGF